MCCSARSATTTSVEFFAHQQDPEANWMAAFGPDDPADRRRSTRTGPASAPTRRIVTAPSWSTARWSATWRPSRSTSAPRSATGSTRRRWGRGHATAALAALLRELPQRPVHARAAKDNAASLAVLRKCGFVVVGEDSGYANGRGAEVEEWLLELPADGADLGDH